MARKEDTTGLQSALLLERLARLMRSAEHDGDLNPAQWEALRYLSRANRFSNSPAALTRYLGATKGTISQTIMALERKGYIAKAVRAGERRSISLTLTPKGEEKLKFDPWARLTIEIADLGGKTRRRFAQGLEELLVAELRGRGLRTFGLCSSCRHLRSAGEPDASYRCSLFNDAITVADTARICVEHGPPD